MKIIIAIIFLSACYFLYRWAISKYRNTDSFSDRRNRAESYLESYPLSVFQRLDTRYIKFITDEQINIVLKEKSANYAEEESKRKYIGDLIYLNSSAINDLLGKSAYDFYTLTKKEVNTIYANKDSLRLKKITAIEKTFKKEVLEYKRRQKYYETFKTPLELSDVERKEYYLTHIERLDKHIDEVIHAKYTYFKHLYPNGFVAYKNKYEVDGYNLSEEEYVDNEDELKELEYQYDETRLFEVWEDEQKEFTQFCRSTLTKGLEFCYHDIDLTLPGYEGMNSDIHYKVGQHFKYLYGNDSELDNIHFSDIIQNRHTFEKYNDKTIDYSKEPFDTTLALINAIQKKYGSVFVLFGGCDASKDANIEFNYKMFQHVLDDKNIRYYEIKERLPVYIPTGYVVIIELYTSNKHLTNLSKNILESFRPIPSFIYISIFKEMDNDEMSKLIEVKNKEMEQKD